MLTIAMMHVGDALVRDAQRRGAVLVHGTLAERDGAGVLLAGTSQVGKSTAARRLPPPCEAAVPGIDTSGTFVYTGPSMNPTLAEPQLLETEDTAGPIRVGDVVCFRSPLDGITVVHRVVAVGPDGIRTRGDRNPSVDPWVLQREDILRRVVCTRRGEVIGGVSGGQKGLLVAATGRLRLGAGRLARRTLRGVYRGLAASGVPARLWSCVAPALQGQRIVRFGTGPLAEHRLYLGERPVGRYEQRQRRWVVDHPYRLLVDEGSLPKPPEPSCSPRPSSLQIPRRDERQGVGDGAGSA
jgi:signal peptidase